MNCDVYATNRKQLREFGLVTGAIVAGLFGLVFPWLFNHPWPRWPWVVGGILAAWGLAAPGTMAPLYCGWMKLGHVLGWVNSRIILGIMFYVIIIPVGFVMRLTGRDPMARKLDPTAGSYRVKSEQPSKNHLERPF